MIRENIGIETIKEILPPEWEKQASELGAIKRGRVIKSAEDLLILNLLYQTSGKSLGGTSAILKSSGKLSMNKNAVNERIQKSTKWNKWLSENISRRAGLLSEKPEWLKNRRVLAIDSTDESCTGSQNADYRLHYSMEIFTLEAIEVKLTDYKEGDKLSQYEAIAKGDIIVADRAYGTIKSIEYAMKYEADYVLRLRANAFNLYDKAGKRIELVEKIRKMKQGAYKELNLNYKSRNKLHPVRLCIYRKTDKESENADSQAKKSQQREDER